MDRFDRFTDGSRRVLTLAQDEAQRFNHNYIGTEHILLGLVREGEGVAARVLENMNVELPKVRTAVEFIIGRGDRPVVGEVGLTPQGKRVIELAIDEARRFGHDYVGTEHLLLGLVREGEGIAAGVLESLAVNLDKVRHEVIRVLAQAFTSGGSDPSWQPVAVPIPIPVEEAYLALQVSTRYQEIQASPLVRVVGIGQIATDAGVSVELIALEVRTAGCVLYWKAYADRIRLLGSPSLSVTDDAETEYSVLPAGLVGDWRGIKGEVLVAPGPPADATRCGSMSPASPPEVCVRRNKADQVGISSLPSEGLTPGSDSTRGRRVPGRYHPTMTAIGTPKPLPLTELTTCGGCAAKLGADLLAQALAGLGAEPRPEELIAGLEPPDDAAAWLVSPELAIIGTLDFFPPIVDDPLTFGEIAAANALSDVFAMGGRVLFALSIAAFPEELPTETLAAIFAGASAKVREAGGVLAGGHTIRDPEPKYGLAVTGAAHRIGCFVRVAPSLATS